jgi:hypothetical protein
MKTQDSTLCGFFILLFILLFIGLAIRWSIDGYRANRRRDSIQRIKQILGYFEDEAGHENAAGLYQTQILPLMEQDALKPQDFGIESHDRLFDKALAAQLVSLSVYKKKSDEIAERIADFQFKKPQQIKDFNMNANQHAYAKEMAMLTRSYESAINGKEVLSGRLTELQALAPSNYKMS